MKNLLASALAQRSAWCAGMLLCGVMAGPVCARPPAKPIEAPLARTNPHAAPITVGSLPLSPCGPAWCGHLTRPFDPAGELPGTIDIAFEFYPQTDAGRTNAGAIVAVEGGPGYPSTGTRSSYLALFAPLRADRHLLLVDNRGTGGSAAVNCPALQHDALYRSASVAACGTALGASAALYGSALAADDLAALLDALGIARVDLYGDSYGTFFAQAFAGRHPAHLRSVVLDAAYAVVGADPWFPEAAPQARAAFDQACARSAACAAQPGPSMGRIDALLNALRAAPVTGTAPDGEGQPQTATADAKGLAYVMFSNGSGPVVYRELDAAARAWGGGDIAPLLRLVAENQTSANSVSVAPRPRSYSAGLFTTVSCADYTQIYRMTDAPAARRAQAASSIAAKKLSTPDLYAPFTFDEFLSMPQDYSVVNLCLPWPVPSAAHPPGQPVPPGTVFPAVPVLVLSGDLDSLTPPAQGAQAAALFPGARQVVIRNTFHVTALGDLDHCASDLVRRFVGTLSAGDTSCADAVPAIRLVPAFARLAAQLAPAAATAGNQGTADDLRAVAAALNVAGDALARWWINHDGDGVGLRGGSFRYTQTGAVTQFTLDAMKWTDDVTVSGTLTRDFLGNSVTARLTLTGANGITGRLTARWPDRGSAALAQIEGRIGGRRIAATMVAP